MAKVKQILPDQFHALFSLLQSRFERNMHRHPGVSLEEVAARLDANPAACRSIYEMEKTGGEPDLIADSDIFAFFDCSPESPSGRRSLCYDAEALDARKENKPEGSALEMAAEMGIDLLDEAHYRFLQRFGKFDAKTSSWVQTPPAIRELGGALFGDYRYGQVFIYHNGAQSYYAARGFRGMVRLG